MFDRAIYRARILHFLSDPVVEGTAAWAYFPEGALWVENGHVKSVGCAATILVSAPDDVPVIDYSDRLLIPGFIDTHIHYPQTEMIASYGEQLLDWLQTYTYPVEEKFSDHQYATEVATFFLRELLRNGTTTAMVFGSVHKASIDAFFQVAQTQGLRMIAGKVLMDRHAPRELLDSPESGYADSRALIQRWHGVDRLQYAVTPRFAVSCSPQQLTQAGRLLKEFPGVYMQTHLSENLDEVAWVKTLFPGARDYTDVYDQFGLLGKRSVLAHGVHLTDDECQCLAKNNSAIAHCPASNLFLGSGLIDLKQLESAGVKLGLATDVGAGNSFSMLRTMADAYKIQQLRSQPLDPMKAFYLATLGGAVALDLDRSIGNFETGKEADFVVLDLAATDLMTFRLKQCENLSEILFVLSLLGDDRNILATYALGKKVYQRQQG